MLIVRKFYVKPGYLRSTSVVPPYLHRPQKICTFADDEKRPFSQAPLESRWWPEVADLIT